MAPKKLKEKKIVSSLALSPEAWGLIDSFAKSYAFYGSTNFKSRSAALEELIKQCLNPGRGWVVGTVWYDGQWMNADLAAGLKLDRMVKEFDERMAKMTPVERRMQIEANGGLAPADWHRYQQATGLEVDGANLYDPTQEDK